MSKVIFGSGIVGLLAKEILGSGWVVVTFSRSRFFSYAPPLDDNYIVRDEKIDDFMMHLGANPNYMYRIAYSVMGQLEPHNRILGDVWLGKVFGTDPPPHAAIYMQSRTGFFVYDLHINKIYEALQNKYGKELKENAEPTVTKIGDHYYEAGGKKYDFDTAISTIPINKLMELCGISARLETKQVWYYHIKTPDLNFEGANQVLVTDPEYAFYKVNNIAPNRYMFYCLQDIPIPGQYFMQFMNRLDLLDGTTIEGVIPIGSKPTVNTINNLGITCVGAHAEHDWCADVGSNIMRLLRIKNRAD